jgi:hypothetical protein
LTETWYNIHVLDGQNWFFEMILAEYDYFSTFGPIDHYYRKDAIATSLRDVVIPSTLLTSAWTFLLFVSCPVAQLLAPIDHLRRFTAFWFRDVEHHPLTAIAWVAGTLIVLGALAIKAVRWIY